MLSKLLVLLFYRSNLFQFFGHLSINFGNNGIQNSRYQMHQFLKFSFHPFEIIQRSAELKECKQSGSCLFWMMGPFLDF